MDLLKTLLALIVANGPDLLFGALALLLTYAGSLLISLLRTHLDGKKLEGFILAADVIYLAVEQMAKRTAMKGDDKLAEALRLWVTQFKLSAKNKQIATTLIEARVNAGAPLHQLVLGKSLAAKATLEAQSAASKF